MWKFDCWYFSYNMCTSSTSRERCIGRISIKFVGSQRMLLSSRIYTCTGHWSWSYHLLHSKYLDVTQEYLKHNNIWLTLTMIVAPYPWALHPFSYNLHSHKTQLKSLYFDLNVLLEVRKDDKVKIFKYGGSALGTSLPEIPVKLKPGLVVRVISVFRIFQYIHFVRTLSSSCVQCRS